MAQQVAAGAKAQPAPDSATVLARIKQLRAEEDKLILGLHSQLAKNAPGAAPEVEKPAPITDPVADGPHPVTDIAAYRAVVRKLRAKGDPRLPIHQAMAAASVPVSREHPQGFDRERFNQVWQAFSDPHVWQAHADAEQAAHEEQVRHAAEDERAALEHLPDE